SKTGLLSHQFGVTRISCTFGQLREYKMAGQRLAVGSLERVFRPVDIRRCKPLALGDAAEAKLADHRHTGHIDWLIEIMAIDFRQFGRQFSSRPAQAAIEFPMSFRRRNVPRQRLQYPFLDVHAPRRNAADSCDTVSR